MPLSSVHILVTYRCTRSCDHCFVFGSPQANAVFTEQELHEIIEQAAAIETVSSVYFEGGEPFLYYDLLLSGCQKASDLGLGIGIVSNGYWATTKERAEELLLPFKSYHIFDLSISDDDLHDSAFDNSPPKIATQVAKELGLPTGNISLELLSEQEIQKGEHITGGGVRYRGRAAEKLAEPLAIVPWQEFTSCPYEELKLPDRVHIDPFGNVLICQGLSIGNCWYQSLDIILNTYHPNNHPITSILSREGPVGLAHEFKEPKREFYADACHLCFELRKSLMHKFPRELAPRYLYGFDK